MLRSVVLSRSLILPAILCLSVILCARAEEKKEPSVEDTIRQRLKKHEDEVGKLRDTMLKECDDELKKLDETIKKARKDMEEARGNVEATRKASETMQKAQRARFRVQAVRSDIERRVQPYTPPQPYKRPPKPEDQRVGIHAGHLPSLLVNHLGLEKDKGIVIEHVSTGSPAAKMGLKQHDILIQVDGKPVPSSHSAFRKLLAELKPDTAVEAVVLRQGKRETIKGFVVPSDPEYPKQGDTPKKPEPTKEKPEESPKKPEPTKEKPAEPTKKPTDQAPPVKAPVETPRKDK